MSELLALKPNKQPMLTQWPKTFQILGQKGNSEYMFHSFPTFLPLFVVCRLSCLSLSLHVYRCLCLRECCACLSCVFVACPLPGHGGEELVRLRFYLATPEFNQHPPGSTLLIYVLHAQSTCICWSILYTQHIRPLLLFLRVSIEGVACCTDCKTPEVNCHM